MSYLNLGDYDSQISNITSQMNALSEKDSALNNIHDRANKAMELAGEAKAFMSSKPVGKYIYSKAKGVLSDAADKAGVNLSEVRTSFQSVIKSGSNVIGRVQSVVNSTGEATSRLVASSSIEGIEGAGVMTVGESGLVKPALDDVFSSSVVDTSASISEGVANLNARAGSLLSRLNAATGQGGAAEQPGILAPQATASIDAGETEKANEQFDKTEAKDELGTGKEEADVAGEEVGEEEGSVATLDLLPGTDIIGLLVGSGLAIGAAIGKPKQLAPVDKINASYQVGI